MPSDVSSGDFEKMQEQAIKRVHEMQQKANPQKKQNETRQNINGQGAKNIRIPQIFRTNDQPVHKPQSEQTQQKRQNEQDNSRKRENSQKQPDNSELHGIFSSLFNMDNDMSMLMPLLLLLGKDGADELLIMALLYIMS